jgi:hypothetical protein
VKNFLRKVRKFLKKVTAIKSVFKVFKSYFVHIVYYINEEKKNILCKNEKKSSSKFTTLQREDADHKNQI